jgi:hypothetical protein
MLLAVLSVRLLLYAAPGVGGSGLAGIHVHHLLLGILIVILGGVPAIVITERGKPRSIARAVFGAGLGLAIDEWVLFVLRDADPQTPYASLGSVLGAAMLSLVTAGYVLLVCSRTGRGPSRSRAREEPDPRRRQPG